MKILEEERARKKRKAAKAALDTQHKLRGVFLAKVVTRSDINDNQNRLQLSRTEVESAPELLRLQTAARNAADARNRDGVGVVIFDRAGRRFEDVVFKLVCNKYYRFMGSGWRRFKDENALTEGQSLEVRGPPAGADVGNAVHCFSFFTASDDDHEDDEEEEVPAVEEAAAVVAKRISRRKSSTPRRSPFF